MEGKLALRPQDTAASPRKQNRLYAAQSTAARSRAFRHRLAWLSSFRSLNASLGPKAVGLASLRLCTRSRQTPGPPCQLRASRGRAVAVEVASCGDILAVREAGCGTVLAKTWVQKPRTQPHVSSSTWPGAVRHQNRRPADKLGAIRHAAAYAKSGEGGHQSAVSTPEPSHSLVPR